MPKRNALNNSPVQNTQQPADNPSLSAPESISPDNQGFSFFTDKHLTILKTVFSDKFIKKIMEPKRFKNFYIYFGCRRKRGSNGHPVPLDRQPKDIARDWFVNYEYYDETTKAYVRVRDHGKDIEQWNKLTTVKERYTSIKDYADALKLLLEKGEHNPLEADPEYLHRRANNITQVNATAGHAAIRNLPVIDALRWVLVRKNEEGASENTIKAYSNCLDHFAEGVDKAGYNTQLLANFTDENFTVAMRVAAEERGMSNKRRNTVAENIGILFSFLKKEKIIRISPAEDFRRLSEEAVVPFKQPTIDEIIEIMAHLHYNKHELWRFIVAFYHFRLREQEVLRVQWRDVDMATGTYNIVPRIEKHVIKKENRTVNRRNRKTKKAKSGKIHPELLNILRMQIKLEPGYKCQPNDFIFGLGYAPGPGEMKRDVVTKDFKKYIKDGLGKTFDLAGIRGVSGGVLVADITDLKLAQDLLGHELSAQTRHYLQNKIHDIMQEKAMEKTPRITGSEK